VKLKNEVEAVNTDSVSSLKDTNELLRKLLDEQIKSNKKLQATIESLQETIKELQRKLNMNSQNSSKPPSTDGFKKPHPTSLRQKSDKEVGGEPKHKGHHMEIPHEPDEKVKHYPDKCLTCPHLKACVAQGKAFTCTQKRYVVDVEVTTKVTEHQSMKAVACPYGEKLTAGSFPENVRAYVQYGNSVSEPVGLLSAYGAVSTERIQVLLNCLWDKPFYRHNSSDDKELCRKGRLLSAINQRTDTEKSSLPL